MERIDEVFNEIRHTEQLLKIIPDPDERYKYCRKLVALMREYRDLVFGMIDNEFNF